MGTTRTTKPCLKANSSPNTSPRTQNHQQNMKTAMFMLLLALVAAASAYQPLVKAPTAFKPVSR